MCVGMGKVVSIFLLLFVAFVWLGLLDVGLLVLTVHLDPDLEAIEPAVIHVLNCCLRVFLLAEVDHGMSINL